MAGPGHRGRMAVAKPQNAKDGKENPFLYGWLRLPTGAGDVGYNQRGGWHCGNIFSQTIDQYIYCAVYRP